MPLVSEVLKRREISTCLSSAKINSINFIFEDPEGCATMLSIYNYPTAFQSKADAMHPIFSKGSVWAIREPTYKFSARGDNPMIRVDSPSDIVPIVFDDGLLQDIIWSGGSIPRIPRPPASVDECRLKGSREFKAQNWLAAAICYTDGLKLDENSVIMRLNRSEAYIRLGWYNSALYDASRAIEAGIEDSALLRKAIFRAAKSCYYIDEYECAIEYADRLPGDKDCAEWKSKAKSRLRERDSGQFDWCALYRESLQERSRPDIADYCGPVEVREGDDGCIRGLFVTREVKLGELLVSKANRARRIKFLISLKLASKPIASYYTEDNPRHKAEVFKSLNLLTNEVTGRDRPAIIAAIAQKMWDDEQLAALVQSMYAGPEGPPPQTFVPAVSKPSSYLKHPLKPEVNIDILRIEGAASYNAFAVEKIGPARFKPSDADSSEVGMALYGLASFCNHSCLPSARRTFFGDVIILRATRPIQQGEEITVEYIGGSGPLSARDKLSRWKFRCTCLQCAADRADGTSACSLREQILKGWLSKEVSIDEAAKRLDQVRKTYSDTPERRSCGIKPALSLAYHNYASALGQRARRDLSYCIPSIEAEMKSLEVIGLRITDKSTSGPSQKQSRLPVDAMRGPTHNPEQCVMTTLQIVAAFNALGDILRAKNWMKVASWREYSLLSRHFIIISLIDASNA